MRWSRAAVRGTTDTHTNMAFEGDLSHLALGDVLQTLAMSRQTGTFILRGASEERRLVFGPRGVGLLTVRQVLRERAGEYLLGKGKVTPEAYEQAVKSSRRKKDVEVVQVLLERQAIDDKQVAEARRYVAAEEIYDLFLWSQGAFEFQSEDPGDTTPFGAAWFDVASIAMEAARRMDEVARLRETAPQTQVFRRKEDAPDPATVKIGADTLKVIDLLDGTRTVDGALAVSHLGRFDTWKAIDSLREAGLVRPATLAEIAAAADVLLRDREHARAADLLRRILELEPGELNARRLLIQALAESGDKKGAAAEWIETARLADAAGDASAAVEGWRQAVRLDKDSAAAQDGFARALLAAGDTASGAEAARAATALHVDARNFEAAVSVATVAVQSCPDDASVRIALANAHIAAGDPANALLLLDDAASLLEATRDDPRRLLDVYRRILQLDPGRKDCARRAQEIESTERFRRRRVAQRVAIAFGIAIACAASIPAFRGPPFEERIELARVAIAEQRIDDAGRLLDELSSDAPTEDEAVQIQGVRDLLASQGPRKAAIEAGVRLERALDRIQREAAEAQASGWATALARYDEALDAIAGPDAKSLQSVDAKKLEGLRRDLTEDVNAALQALQTYAAAASAEVSGAREKFGPEVFKKEDPAVLADLVERTEKVARIRASQDWPAVVKSVESLRERVSRLKDGVDKKIVDAIQPMSEAFAVVEKEGARACAALRKRQLLDRQREAHGRGQELLGAGKVEQAADVCKAFLATCDDLRRAEPRELYEPIVRDYVDGMDMEAPQRERLAQIGAVLDAERDADAALERGDVTTAFSIRAELVRKHRNVDFRPRFRLPVRIESRPAGASVFLLDSSPAGRFLGRTPLPRFEYPLDAGARIAVRLDGFEERTIDRRGALEDEGGVVTVELPKQSIFAVAGLGNVQAAPVATAERIVLGGRDGRVRVHSTRDGAELVAPFDTGSLAGIAGSPAVHAGRVFVATLDATGFVLDEATLERRRELRFDGPVRASLLAVPEGVIVVSELGTAQLLDADGNTKWTARLGKVLVDPARSGTRALFVTAGGEIVALDAGSGREEFRIPLPEDPRWGPPLASGDRVWVAGDGGLVACVDLTSRKVVWQVPVGSPVRARPGVADGRLLVGTSNGSLHSLDPWTGRSLGRELLGAPVVHAPLALDVGWVVTTEKGAVLRFDATGALVWRYEAKEDLASPAGVAGGRVVFVTRRGVLVALRP